MKMDCKKIDPGEGEGLDMRNSVFVKAGHVSGLKTDLGVCNCV